MGLRFRKSIKIAPGVKLNLGKKSAGISVGGKYGGISVNSKTGTHARVSAPGTGLSYTQKISSPSQHCDDSVKHISIDEQANLDQQRLETNLQGVRLILPILCVLLLVLGLIWPISYVVVVAVCWWWKRWLKGINFDMPLFFQRWWFIALMVLSALSWLILLTP